MLPSSAPVHGDNRYVAASAEELRHIESLLKLLQATCVEVHQALVQQLHAHGHDLPPVTQGTMNSQTVTVHSGLRTDIVIPDFEYVVKEPPLHGTIERLRPGLVGYRARDFVGNDRIVLSRAAIHAHERLDPRCDFTVNLDIVAACETKPRVESLPSVAELSRSISDSSHRQWMMGQLDALIAVLQQARGQKNASPLVAHIVAFLQRLTRPPVEGAQTISQTQTSLVRLQNTLQQEIAADSMVLEDTADPTELLCTAICSASWMSIVDHFPWSSSPAPRDGSWRQPFAAVAVPFTIPGLYSHGLQFAHAMESRFLSFVTWQPDVDKPVFPANRLHTSEGVQPALLTMKHESKKRVSLAFHLPGYYALAMHATSEPRIFYFHVIAPSSRVAPALPDVARPNLHMPVLLVLMDARLSFNVELDYSARALVPLAVTSELAETAEQEGDLRPVYSVAKLWQHFSSLNNLSTENSLRVLRNQIELFNRTNGDVLRRSDAHSTNEHELELIKKLHQAVSTDDIRTTIDLLDQGAPVDGLQENVTPLRVAAWHGHFNVAQLLIERGADVNAASKKDVGTPIMSAALMGNERVFRLLREKGADINHEAHTGGTALFCTCIRGFTAMTALAIELGADVNARACDGTTAMHLAAMGGKADDAEVLLKAGALPNVLRADGITPLCFAASGGHLRICQMLLDLGVSPNHRADDGMTPLCYAADSGHTACCALLIERGATDYLSIPDKAFPLDTSAPLTTQWRSRALATRQVRFTPLVCAAAAGHAETCALLLRAGADPLLAAPGNPDTPPMVAAAAHPSVLRVFRQFLEGQRL